MSLIEERTARKRKSQILLVLFLGSIMLAVFIAQQPPNPKPDLETYNRVAVEMWLEENARDPKSLTILQIGAVGTDEVMVRYRAKNGYGGYDTATNFFKVVNGRVLLLR